MAKKSWWQEHGQSETTGGTDMEEKAVRLDEVQKLEDCLNGHSVGTDNPDHVVRVHVRKRRDAIEKEFAPPDAGEAVGA